MIIMNRAGLKKIFLVNNLNLTNSQVEGGFGDQTNGQYFLVKNN